ncbi:endonuclease VII domain-containing protein [Mycobacteroides abscessus]|nr:endonuclease VII domain-containing protein [Mycobacteroides abscessus]
MKTYGITAEQYWAIYEYQGGCCWICRRAKGTGSKRLSVDHDHKTGYVRGLLCSPCNRGVLGHLRDDRRALFHGIQYLNDPPAFDVIGKVVAPIESGQGLDIRPETKEGT